MTEKNTIDLSDLLLDSTMGTTPYTYSDPTYNNSILTHTGVNVTWATDSYVVGNYDVSHNQLSVTGDANFDGDVKIKGKSIADSIDRIEERLAILRPNEELEAKWENLRGLRKAYMELEAEIKEKEQIWATLKK